MLPCKLVCALNSRYIWLLNCPYGYKMNVWPMTFRPVILPQFIGNSYTRISPSVSVYGRRQKNTPGNFFLCGNCDSGMHMILGANVSDPLLQEVPGAEGRISQHPHKEVFLSRYRPRHSCIQIWEHSCSCLTSSVSTYGDTWPMSTWELT